jgi:hypothetical protein
VASQNIEKSRTWDGLVIDKRYPGCGDVKRRVAALTNALTEKEYQPILILGRIHSFKSDKYFEAGWSKRHVIRVEIAEFHSAHAL